MLRSMGNDATELAPANGGGLVGFGSDGPAGAAPLIDVLWQRRRTLLATLAACLTLGAAYLFLSTPVYNATSRVEVRQNVPKVLGDGRGDAGPVSENFLETHVNVIESTPVLARALDKVGYAELATFAGVTGDPAEWLRRSGALTVETARKSDVIAVTVESPHAAEAAELSNAIVNAYIVEQALQMRSAGSEMVAVLQRERDDLERKRGAVVQQMLTSTRRSGVLSFGADKVNTVVDRMASLASSLTAAEIAAIELRSQQESVRAVLANPASISSFAQSLQAKGTDGNDDREYGELRSQLAQYTLALANAKAVQGPNNRRVQALEVSVNSLRDLIAVKERAIVAGHLALLDAQATSAEEQQQKLRKALASQRELAMDQSPEAAEYRRLELEADRLQRQCDLIDGRIAEIRVNSVEASPTSVTVIEPARPAARPVKPKKVLTLAACLMAGSVLGIGVSMLREWQDARLRTPEEIRAVLGTAVIAMIPRINPRFSPVTRGQLVRLDARSPAAEGYRGVRTLLQLGSSSGAKTILIASPASGDGKSTTASNLAIALAQAGERTLLLDCDLRQPVQHMIFEVDGQLGLSSVLADEASLRDAIAATAVAGLFVLPAGPLPANPSELLTGKRFSKLMHSLAKSFDRIVIDSPPLMNVTDARILAASADATILVLRMNRSMRRLGVLAIEGLDKVGANVLGALANDVPVVGEDRSYAGSATQYEGDSKRMINEARAGGRPEYLPAVIPPNPAIPIVTIDGSGWAGPDGALGTNATEEVEISAGGDIAGEADIVTTLPDRREDA